MSFKSVVALFIMALILVSVPAFAQDDPPEDERTFKLSRESGTADSGVDLGSEEEEIWVPSIEKGTIEVSFALGSLGMSTTLLSHDQIIYKYTDEATFWGDVELKGQSAFQPMVRIGYNLSPWLSLEAIGAFSFSEYSGSAENRTRRSNEPGSSPDFLEPALGEFDMEARSLLTANAGINAVVYFLNLDGEGKGRLHPYATGGVGNMWYSMNSNYIAEAASTIDFNIGGGVRLLADKNISIRLEAIYHFNSVEFTPSKYFTERNEGTVKVPLDEFPVVNGSLVQQNVTSYSSNSVGALGISIGLQGSF